MERQSNEADDHAELIYAERQTLRVVLPPEVLKCGRSPRLDRAVVGVHTLARDVGQRYGSIVAEPGAHLLVAENVVSEVDQPLGLQDLVAGVVIRKNVIDERQYPR